MADIVEKRKVLMVKLAKAKAKVEKIKCDLRALTAACTHPNAYLTSHMGENCKDCPDCGSCLW